MIKFLRSLNVQICCGFYIFLALALLTIPLRCIVAWLIYAIFHEVGHIVAIITRGHQIEKIEIGWNGAKICTNELGHDECICAIAGPAFGLLLVLLISCFPWVGICAAAQSVINIIPVLPLDGGRVLKSLLSRFMSEAKANKVTNLVGVVLIGTFLHYFGRFMRRQYFIILIAFFVVCLRKIVEIKIPCKPSCKWVQ